MTNVPQLTVVAHRGASAVAIENTLDAFQRAISLGATVIETDVRPTRDGELVLLHDPTLTRIAGRTDRVDECTWAELRDLPLSTTSPESRICRLTDVCHLLQDQPATVQLLLDLKPPLTYAAALKNSLWEARLQDRAILGVRSLQDLQTVQRDLPGVQTLGFGSTLEDEWTLAAAGVDILRLWATWLDAARIARACSYGRPIWVIGGGSSTPAPAGAATLEDLLTYRKLGLNGVLVNDVALAVKANAHPLG